MNMTGLMLAGIAGAITTTALIARHIHLRMNPPRPVRVYLVTICADSCTAFKRTVHVATWGDLSEHETRREIEWLTQTVCVTLKYDDPTKIYFSEDDDFLVAWGPDDLLVPSESKKQIRNFTRSELRQRLAPSAHATRA